LSISLRHLLEIIKITDSKVPQTLRVIIFAVVVPLGLISQVSLSQATSIEEALQNHPLTKVFPGADNSGKTTGTPPAAPVFRKNKLVGYLFLTSDIVRSTGYSGKPVEILAGLDLAGKITGAAVIKHQEPILILGISDEQLNVFIAQLKGKDARQRIRFGKASGSDEVAIDMLSGATITSLVLSDSITRSARQLGRSRGIFPQEPLHPSGDLDNDIYYDANWPNLLVDGSIRRLRITNGDVATAFSLKKDPENEEKTFIEMFSGLATPAAVSQNLLGFAAYNQLKASTDQNAQILFVAAQGFYSFRGYNFRRSGKFERLQLVQGEKTIRLTKEMHLTYKKLMISGAPELREISMFILPRELGFNPIKPWRLEILVEKDIPDIGQRFASFPLNYALPQQFIRVRKNLPETSTTPIDVDAPLWEVRWRENLVQIIVMVSALSILLVLLVFQDWAVKHRTWINWFRIGFLAFTLLYIGWTVAAQLSVINVLTFVNALLHEFHWDFFLLEPLVFILWGFVAVTLLFWGRGVFCGWLCPFGALQELINRIGQFANLPQISLPFGLNERLWAVKYILFLGLLALSLGPEGNAERMVEIEPFKTTISLKFNREWPFVTYALMILVVSLFSNRIFCRYLCPLGAALAIPANNRMFDWLKRYHECGTECQICAVKCPVQAIHPDGHIDLHECIYCLNCQNNYHNDYICPPQVAKRKRVERRTALSSGQPSLNSNTKGEGS
jgi:NosR/NirI family transcriptional regulator, nitrous oxide reductase regulator